MPQIDDAPLRDRELPGPAQGGEVWKLEDAKARFSEVVRRARSEGPQRVSVRGRDAVVVMAADEFDRLHPLAADRLPFVAFLETLSGEGLDLTREGDTGRDVAL